MQKLGFALLTVLGATLVVGCKPSPASVCDSVCDCQGCSDRQYDDCVDDLEDAEREADRAGCLPEYDDLLACTLDEAECRNDVWSADGCLGEALDLLACTT